MKPNKAENYVLDALKTNKRARTSDFILYGSVLKRMGLNLDMTLKEFLTNATSIGVPSFETVSRCRRKLQEQMPELKDEQVAVARENKTIEYINYNREN